VLAASAFAVKKLDSLNPKYGGRKASKEIWKYCDLKIETEGIIQKNLNYLQINKTPPTRKREYCLHTWNTRPISFCFLDVVSSLRLGHVKLGYET